MELVSSLVESNNFLGSEKLRKNLQKHANISYQVFIVLLIKMIGYSE